MLVILSVKLLSEDRSKILNVGNREFYTEDTTENGHENPKVNLHPTW